MTIGPYATVKLITCLWPKGFRESSERCGGMIEAGKVDASRAPLFESRRNPGSPNSPSGTYTEPLAPLCQGDALPMDRSTMAMIAGVILDCGLLATPYRSTSAL